MIHARLLIALASLTLLSGCISIDADVTVDGCPTGLTSTTTAELIFGRNIGDTPGVSDADWQAFLATEVTPRFPEGLTVVDAAGQWRSPSGAVVQEASKVLLLVLTGAPGERARLDAVRAAYKTRFHQEAVLLIERPACVGF